ncbi:hypothetical protein [Romboutsia lituseburensis]|uniref:hypothetical protein n=1 Tax=Romboutsia lituseburensis TaxID=1537 RepID=UPI00215AAECD|nr:hypothetical protein [Romboutsia lituseburensis]MCR8744350.1 hypothetical protein [Romboutsia lituseburensis]
MKVWKEASEISMIHELPDRKLRELDIEMRKKPNFDKSKESKVMKNRLKLKK